jgi:hypothetical protein
MRGGGRAAVGFAVSAARCLLLSVFVLASLVGLPARAEQPEIVTLGTMAGPMGNPHLCETRED